MDYKKIEEERKKMLDQWHDNLKDGPIYLKNGKYKRDPLECLDIIGSLITKWTEDGYVLLKEDPEFHEEYEIVRKTLTGEDKKYLYWEDILKIDTGPFHTKFYSIRIGSLYGWIRIFDADVRRADLCCGNSTFLRFDENQFEDRCYIFDHLNIEILEEFK